MREPPRETCLPDLQPPILWPHDSRRLIYFGAADSVSGVELWRTDGTTDGTWIVKDINPGPAARAVGFTTVHGTTYFQANDGVTGLELWRTDGTAAGHHARGDLMPGSWGSEPSDLEALGDTLLFSATYGVTGTELWKVTGGRSSGPSRRLDGRRTQYDHGTGFTAGSVVQIFVSTVNGCRASRPLEADGLDGDVAHLRDPGDVPLANGFAAVQVVNTTRGSSRQCDRDAALRQTRPSTSRPSDGARHGPRDTRTWNPVAHVDTVASRGETITITGTGFNAPLVNLFTGTANIGRSHRWAGVDADQLPGDGSDRGTGGPGNFQVVNNRTPERAVQRRGRGAGEPACHHERERSAARLPSRGRILFALVINLFTRRAAASSTSAA